MSHLLDQLLDARRAEECKTADLAMLNPTTRRHPRTLEEAFPHEAPPVVEGPHKRPSIDIGWQVSIYVGVVLLIVLLIHIAMKWGQV